MTTNSEWAIIRQVVIGTDDLERDSATLRSTLGLAEGFADPLLDDVGLADETIRVGAEAHLEFVAPLNDTAPINGWIAKHGGGGGYAMAVQVPDVQAVVDRAHQHGVRVGLELEAYGRRIVQFHPGDMGVLVEIDEIPNPSEWFWDDIEVVTPPAPVVDDVLAVEVQSPDPSAQAELWAAVFGVELDEWNDVPRITLGTRTVNFVKGDRKMLSAVDLRRIDGTNAPDTLTISGVLLRLR